MRQKKCWSVVTGLLSAVLCLGLTVLPVHAENIAGYHEKTVSVEEAEDTWYAVGRGTYLSYGTAKVSRAGKAKVTISGSTIAHSVCDELKLALYLDESSNNSNYGTIGTYHYSDTQSGMLSGGETDLSVTSGYYYSVRGVHQAIEGNVTESTDTCTDAITAL